MMNEPSKPSVPMPVLQIEDLRVAYRLRDGSDFEAVRGVSLAVRQGEWLGIVGESGCGKTTLGLAALRYVGDNGRISGGRVLYDGRDVLTCSDRDLRAIRGGEISMVFQNPSTALHPALRIGFQIREGIRRHTSATKSEAKRRAVEMLGRVGMPDPRGSSERFPHELSGGMQQRAVIAMALATEPRVVIMDEPTTALDVTTQAGILALIEEVRTAMGLTVMYVTHNVGILEEVADRVGVMYAGRLVETGEVNDVLQAPRHPYTVGLLRSVPVLGETRHGSILPSMHGRPPGPEAETVGCAFAPRCSMEVEACSASVPELAVVDTAERGHTARCFRWRDVPTLVEGARSPTPLSPKFAGMPRDKKPALLEASGLTFYFPAKRSPSLLHPWGETAWVQAVNDVSLTVPAGTTLALVGESGSGKSTLAKCLVGLLPARATRLEFDGEILPPLVRSRSTEVLRAIQMVFQNPDSTLNPSHKIGQSLARPVRRFRGVGRKEAQQGARDLLRMVSLDDSFVDRYPRELSGGEKQRVAIARAFAGAPRLLVADEITSALDVSVQASVVNLLNRLQDETKCSYIYISHDLSIVVYLSDFIAVMYLGQIVELGPAASLLIPPNHPYTEALLASIPGSGGRHDRLASGWARGRGLAGEVPSALDPPQGCRFHTRCPRKIGMVCETTVPPRRVDSHGKEIVCHIPLRELEELQLHDLGGVTATSQGNFPDAKGS